MLSAWRVSTRTRRVQCATAAVNLRRSLLTLAIESSCDDTSVAILEKTISHNSASTSNVQLHFHEKITSNNVVYRGVHPIVALESHEENLAQLVEAALRSLPLTSNNAAVIHDEETASVQQAPTSVCKPDFITVTRGPGMRSSLATGLNMAKGLAVAWKIPLVAVNHMQAHALTPRLVSALESTKAETATPTFPFLSLLVSGGHTMLINSKTLTEHPTIATTVDIAIGDAIDKMARVILPSEILETSKSTMYGPLLESFAFPDINYRYTAPRTREQELKRRVMSWGWSFGPPLAETRSGSKSKALEYSFTGLCSSAKRIVEDSTHPMTHAERRDLAKECMRVAFEHLASRVVLFLNHLKETNPPALKDVATLVVSGGVAANSLRAFLDARGFSSIQLVFPPLSLCTDNAAMIAWAGIEMYEAGYTSALSCRSLRKWSLDPDAEDGGVLGVPGWSKRTFNG